VATLKGEYEGLAAAIEGKSALYSGIAPYVSALSVDLATATLAELEVAEKNLRRMIEVARNIGAEETANKDRERKRSEIASYRSAMPGIREKIRETERNARGWWGSPFTDTYDAAMACMPIAHNPEEEYCVARNAYEMGRQLVGGAQRTYNEEGAETLWGEAPTKGTVYTPSELRSFATGYCSTECR
jgi:hypothetical protein